MTLSYSSTDFENDSDFRPSLARCCQIQVMSLNALRISLADYVQLSFRRDSYSGQPSVIHTTTSKADSRLIRRFQRRHSAFTEDVRHNRLRILSYA